MKHLLITLFFLTTAISNFYGQKGILTGKVTDAKTGEELFGATVSIEGTTIGAVTDFTGDYTLSGLVPGSYKIRCQYISYGSQLKENITITANNTTSLNFQIANSEVKLEEVKVVAKANRESETMLLMEQKNAVIATQSIGAQELSRKGVSDAEGAVTKVAGISKQEGVKNVFVRGLGDRFNSTSMNGFLVPSEDPEYKNISLDFFASDMIQSVGVNKVFGSSMTGDVAGADINITSKELTTNSEFSINAKLGVNSQAVNQDDFLKTDGVNTFGYSIPSEGPTDITQYTFKNSLDPSSQSMQLNNGYSASGGKKILVGNESNPLTFYVLGSYDNNYEYREGTTRNTTTTGIIFKDMEYDKYRQNTSHMILGNLNYRFQNNQLSYNSLYIHTNIQTMSDYLGKNSTFADVDDENGFLRRQQINDNALFVNQLIFKGELTNRLAFDLGSSLNLVQGNEPDRRMNYLSDYDNDLYHPTKGTGRQQRYYSEMSESDLNLKMALNYKLTNNEDNISNVSFGYTGRFVNRSFNAIEYDHQVTVQPDMYLANLRFDDFFNQSGLDNSEFILDRNNDEYSVNKYLNSGFGEVVYQLSKKLVGVAGMRVDKVDMNVDYLVNKGGTKGSTKIDELFILPSLNLKYQTSEKNAFRMGLSRTYILPQAKEISPFRYTGEDFLSQGNPNLKSSTSINFDLKWDYYISQDELLAVTGFFKYIQLPISRVEKASAGGYLTYDNISDHTTVEGIEVEFRKNLWKPSNNKLSVGVNASYIMTDVKLPDANFTNKQSQLEGASPIILNADLSYLINKEEFSLTNSLVFNYFSDRIYTIGTQGYQDIIEKGLPTLDYVASCKLNKHWGLGLKVKNITNPLYQISRKPNTAGQDAVVLNSFTKGVSMSFGITYKL